MTRRWPPTNQARWTRSPKSRPRSCGSKHATADRRRHVAARNYRVYFNAVDSNWKRGAQASSTVRKPGVRRVGRSLAHRDPARPGALLDRPLQGTRWRLECERCLAQGSAAKVERRPALMRPTPLLLALILGVNSVFAARACARATERGGSPYRCRGKARRTPMA